MCWRFSPYPWCGGFCERGRHNLLATVLLKGLVQEGYHGAAPWDADDINRRRHTHSSHAGAKAQQRHLHTYLESCTDVTSRHHTHVVPGALLRSETYKNHHLPAKIDRVVSSLGNESMSSGQGGCWAASEESRLTASETRIAALAFTWSSTTSC